MSLDMSYVGTNYCLLERQDQITDLTSHPSLARLSIQYTSGGQVAPVGHVLCSLARVRPSGYLQSLHIVNLSVGVILELGDWAAHPQFAVV